MNKRVITVLVMVFALLSLVPTAAFSAGQSVIIPSAGIASTCVVSSGFNFPTSYVFTGTGSDRFQMTAPGYGQLNSAFTEEPDIGYPVGSGNNSYGTGDLNYSLPDHTAITLTVTTFAENNYMGTQVAYYLTYDCTTGATLAQGMIAQAPPIPTGFVLRTITCDTPVYDTAGGSPLATGQTVTVGQTWFVSPTATAAEGTNWTEIFNNGVSNGFIPTACIGGIPAGYTGN